MFCSHSLMFCCGYPGFARIIISFTVDIFQENYFIPIGKFHIPEGLHVGRNTVSLYIENQVVPYRTAWF
jgi:hypothetical protein